MESSEAEGGVYSFLESIDSLAAEFHTISNDVKRDWRRLGSYSYPDAIKFWTFPYLLLSSTTEQICLSKESLESRITHVCLEQQLWVQIVLLL